MSDRTDQRPDPRIAETRRMVHQATLAELGERGYGGFTIESVAERANVAKSTIYRHWDGKPALIADALRALNKQPLPEPGNGSLRQQVSILMHHLVEVMRDPQLSPTLPAIIEAAEHDTDMAELHHENNRRRGQTMVDVIRAGVEIGHLPKGTNPELTATALVAPIFYHRLMTNQTFPPDQVDALIDLVIGQEIEPRRE